VRILVCGGAGFIGSAFVRSTLATHSDWEMVVLDALTYAGNIENLSAVWNDTRFRFVHGDICDEEIVCTVVDGCDAVVNFAAETHVDRSIQASGVFVRTDIEGTRVLLDAARDAGLGRFVQVSTDEVYGHVERPRRSRESDQLCPRSPYAASKAGADLMVLAYHATFDVPTLITRGSNTYGPYQYPEKLVPLCITNALTNVPIPMYGDGMQIRDWLHVDDHVRGIETVLLKGRAGGVYNVGTGVERPNRDVIETIITLTGAERSLVRSISDRPGHDRRYALATEELRTLGWEPVVQFEEGLEQAVHWYRDHPRWWQPVKGQEFQAYYESQYADRLREAERR
jgi:dTDP-glucose 4,6-dehydratase